MELLVIHSAASKYIRAFLQIVLNFFFAYKNDRNWNEIICMNWTLFNYILSIQKKNAKWSNKIWHTFFLVDSNFIQLVQLHFLLKYFGILTFWHKKMSFVLCDSLVFLIFLYLVMYSVSKIVVLVGAQVSSRATKGFLIVRIFH
jgi:hypothetical protein